MTAVKNKRGQLLADLERVCRQGINTAWDLGSSVGELSNVAALPRQCYLKIWQEVIIADMEETFRIKVIFGPV